FYSKEYANPTRHPSLDVIYTATGVDDGQLVRYRTVSSYPNPFNPETTIRYYLPAGTRAALRIYDARGRLVRELFDSVCSAGEHEALWDGTDDHGRPASSGVYFYALETAAGDTEGRMVLLK
ncbi:T9SS type A sorting domain-containing protein, partial [bacterium]|nr:T9SS type A sorting domain-containing protein [bacterium]